MQETLLILPLGTQQVVHFQFGSVIGVVSAIQDRIDLLSSRERQQIGRAVVKRQREYSTARWLAKDLLRRFHEVEIDLINGPNRAPIWPAGFLGSISHSDYLCVVVVAEQGQLDGIGVDIEYRAAVQERLRSAILTERESENFVSSAPNDTSLTTFFSAKESVFKAVSPIVGLMIDYKDVELAFSVHGGEFRARYVGGNPRNLVMNQGMGVAIKYESHELTLFTLPAKQRVNPYEDGK